MRKVYIVSIVSSFFTILATSQPAFAQTLSWSIPESVTGGPQTRFGEPIVARDRLGNIHVVWSDSYKVYYKKRTDTTWGTMVQLSSLAGLPATSDFSIPRMTIGINNIPHVVFLAFTRGPGTTSIYHTSYENDAWQTPVVVSRPSQRAYMLRNPLAVGSDGIVHVIWKETLGPIGDQIFYRQKSGGVWSNDVQVTGNDDQTLQAAVLVDDTSVRIIGTTYRTNLIRERRLIGTSWQHPTVLFSNVPIRNDSFTGAQGANGGYSIGWVRVAGSTFTLEVSSLTGSTWSAPVSVFAETPPRIPREPILSVDDYRQAHVVFWADPWQGVNTSRIIHAYQGASGWTAPVAISTGSNADAGWIFVHDKAYAVWRQWFQPNYDIYFTETREIERRTPVVLVPGIAASWNWGVMSDLNSSDTNWMWAPTADKGWKGLIASLEAAGYQKDRDYTVAFYDWRKTNDWLDGDQDAGRPAKVYLKAAIDTLKAANPSVSKVHVVGHSIGGLVIRSYVESPEYRGDIDQAILVGTPNQGAAFSYYMWSGAEVPPNWDVVSRTAAYTYLRYLEIIKGKNSFQVLRDHTKSIRNLLPVNVNYLRRAIDSIDWITMDALNTFLKNTSSIDTVVSRFSSKGVQLSTIYGTGTKTVYSMSVDPYQISFGQLWKDGKPNGDSTVLTGDGTVTEASAKISGVENMSITSPHARLPSDAAETIMRKLGRTHTPVTIAVPASIMTVWSYPTTDVIVEDPDTSVPIGTKLEEKPDEGFKVVTIPEPKKPTYKIKLKGKKDGKFSVGTDLHTELTSSSSQKQGTAKKDVTVTYTVNVATQSATPIIVQPDDTKAPTTSLSTTGSQSGGSFVESATITLSSDDGTDGTGIAVIEYNTDGTTWKGYSLPITVNSIGTTTLSYRSTDLVGNMEATKSAAITIVNPSPTPSSSSNTSSSTTDTSTTNTTSQVLGTQTQQVLTQVAQPLQTIADRARTFVSDIIDRIFNEPADQTNETSPDQTATKAQPEVKAQVSRPFFTKDVIIASVVVVTVAGGVIGVSIATGSGLFGKFKP